MAGQRLADTGRHVLGAPDYAVDRLAQSVAGYLREQTSLVASGEEARIFAEQNASLADRVRDLEARIAALVSRFP